MNIQNEDEGKAGTELAAQLEPVADLIGQYVKEGLDIFMKEAGKLLSKEQVIALAAYSAFLCSGSNAEDVKSCLEDFKQLTTDEIEKIN